jgi:plastocyanin
VRRTATIICSALVALAGASSASAAQPGVQRLHFKVGPLTITPGQNIIQFRGGIPQPKQDGYMVGFAPNIRWAAGPGGRRLGKVPPVDVIHLHHGVWLSSATSGPFAAAGEEKTRMILPAGYGYPYRASERWALNYMIHNLYDNTTRVWVTYDVDFIPATSPAAKRIIPARPVWMDVEAGSIYPVFDVHRGSGTRGRFTFPTQAKDPYGGGWKRNERPMGRSGTLIWTAGHLHPGGLHTDLWLRRGARTAHLFRSSARYWEPAGAVSWDVAMTATPKNWRVDVRPGDVLSTTATYDSRRASWYESMGIMVVYMADGLRGSDPFRTKVDAPGKPTHGHLAENDHHGGEPLDFSVNALRLKGGPAAGLVTIRDFLYRRGAFLVGGRVGRPPTVKAGRSLTFKNLDDAPSRPVWHTITACRAPCNRQTGIAYPLANAAVEFDSGQLGVHAGGYAGPGGPPTAGRLTWQTPRNLRPGTYTFFCRVHPFMRGAFRVVR